MNYKWFFKEKVNEKLPETRKKQFIDVIKNDFSLLVNLSLLSFIFSFPLYILLILMLRFISMTDFSFAKVFPITLYMSLISILLFAIKGLGKGATYNILKKRIYNEGCVVVPAFFKSIKENFKDYFLSYLIVGISFSVGITISCYFLYNTTNNVAKGLGIGVMVLQFIIVYISTQYFLNQTATYTLKFKDNYKNARAFTLITFIYSLLFSIITLFIPAFLAVLSNVLLYLVLFIIAIIYEGITCLIASLYSTYIFDQYINQTSYPSYVNKGLAKKEN